MKFRQTHTTAVAAAKASISTATAYRHEKDSRLPPDLRGDIKAVVTLYRRSRDTRNAGQPGRAGA